MTLIWYVNVGANFGQPLPVHQPKALPVIGQVVGTAIGTFIGGPVGGQIGGFIGGTLGRLGAAALSKPVTLDSQVEIRGGQVTGHPVRRYAIGRFRTAPENVYRYVDGEELDQSFLVASEPIEDFEEWWLYGDTHLTPLTDTAERTAYDMDSAGARLDGVFSLPRGNYDRGQVEAWIGLGDQTKFPDEWIVRHGAKVPKLAAASWKSNAIWHQQAWFGDPHDANRRWRGGWPTPEIVLRGGFRYDPTKDGTLPGGSGAHRRDDPDTWEFDRKAATNALHVLRDRHGLGKPNKQIIIADWQRATLDCARLGYNADGLLPIDTRETDLLQPILRSMGGFLTTSHGRFGVRAGAWHSPWTFEDTAVYFALDISGSMDGIRLATMKAAVKDLLDELEAALGDDASHVRMVGFESAIRTSIGRDSVDASAFDDLRAWVDGLTATGGTDYEAAVSEAQAFFDARPGKTPIIVFVTDGLPTEGSLATAAATVDATGAASYAFNIELADTSATAELDNTPDDEVPVLEEGDAITMTQSLLEAFPVERLSKPLVEGFRWTGRSLPSKDAVVAKYIDEDRGWRETSTRKVLCECLYRRKVASASYTLVLGDAETHVRMAEANASVTVPSLAYPAFTRVVVEFVQGGTIVAGSGVTLTAPDGLFCAAGEFARLVLVSADTWRVEITTMDQVLELDLPLVSGGEQATQLAKLEAMRLWHNRTIEGFWWASEYKHRVGDTVQHVRTDLPIQNGTYMVEAERDEVRDAPGGGQMILKWMSLREDSRRIYLWDADSEYEALPASTTSATYTDLDTLLTLDCYQEDYLDTNGLAQARLVGEATVGGGLSAVRVQFEWQYAGNATWTPLTTVDLDLEALAAGETATAIAHHEPAYAGVSYKIRARVIHGDVGDSSWVECSHTIVAPSLDTLGFEDGSGHLLMENGFALLLD